jgi:hypothetical protein
VRYEIYLHTTYETLSPDPVPVIVEDEAEKARKKQRVDNAENAKAQYESEFTNIGLVSNDFLPF